MPILFSILLGFFVGLICYIFGATLIFLSNFRDEHKYIIFVLPFIGSITYYIYGKYANNLKLGMKHIKNSYNNMGDIDKKLIPFISISTWLSHLFGASVGREGVAVQIGASFSNLTYKYFKVKKQTALLAGMSAGFSGLFGTPLSAIAFSLEIFFDKNKKYTIYDIFLIVIASFSSSFTSEKLGLSHFKFKETTSVLLSFRLVLICVLSAILFSFFSILFTRLTKKLKVIFQKNIKTIFILSIILTLIIYFTKDARYAGLGTNIIGEAFKNMGDSILAIDFILKLLLTSFSLSLFYQGGEVTPLFAIGSSLGVIIAKVFYAPVYLFASVGYIGVFSACTNTLITPILIMLEVFGPNYLVYAIISSVLIKILSYKNSIY